MLVRFAFSIIVLLTVVGTSRAAEWGTLIKRPELLVSMDLAGLRATANHVKVWFLWEYRKPRVLHSSPRRIYLSSTNLYYLNCQERTIAFARAIFYEKLRAQGEVITSLAPERLEFKTNAPGSIGATMVQAACAAYWRPNAGSNR
jgi:hypothetical protein